MKSDAYPPATALGEHARIEGDLQLTDHAVIAGHVTGDVRATGRIELTATARVDGSVYAHHVVLAGHIAGHLTAKAHTHLRAGCRLDGGLTTSGLAVDPGVTFEGPVRIVAEADQVQPPEDASVSTTTTPEPAADTAMSESVGRLNLELRRQRVRRQATPMV